MPPALTTASPTAKATSASSPTPTMAPLAAASPTVRSATPTPAPIPAELRDGVETARRHRRNGDLANAVRAYRQVVATGKAPPSVLLELAAAELASGDAAAARDTAQRLLKLGSTEPIPGRARLLLVSAELALGNAEEALRHLDADAAPDGLVDLVILRRAEALVKTGDRDGAKRELERIELRSSTNRLLLEKAGQLADKIGEPALAAQFYIDGARYPGWAEERSRLLKAAAVVFERAGRQDRAIDLYQKLIEGFGWTGTAVKAGVELERLGGMTAYHRGVLAMETRKYQAARAAFAEAVEKGPFSSGAADKLRKVEEKIDWLATFEKGSAEGFQSFRGRYPDGTYAGHARFHEGLAHYQAGRFEQALRVWDEGLSEVRGDDLARLHLWAGKALARLGRDADSRARLQAASETEFASYYPARARDLLAGVQGWPKARAVPLANPKIDRERERAEALEWIGTWAGEAPTVDIAEGRVSRGLGLLALGMNAEAVAEVDAAIVESGDGHFLFLVAELLEKHELWSSSTRAALYLIGASPSKRLDDVPVAVRRLAYPMAYADLVKAAAEQRDFDPLLLLALMRQESRYDRFAVSPSDARGLTQVLPSTGRSIATNLGRKEFVADDLYRPSISVDFGSRFLANQLTRFGQDPFRAIAAYNAGPGPVPRWSANDPDLFVERIDYDETRNYVRLIYRHYAVYRGLANG